MSYPLIDPEDYDPREEDPSPMPGEPQGVLFAADPPTIDPALFAQAMEESPERKAARTAYNAQGVRLHGAGWRYIRPCDDFPTDPDHPF